MGREDIIFWNCETIYWDDMYQSETTQSFTQQRWAHATRNQKQ